MPDFVSSLHDADLEEALAMVKPYSGPAVDALRAQIARRAEIRLEREEYGSHEAAWYEARPLPEPDMAYTAADHPIRPAMDAPCTEEWCDTRPCEAYPFGGFVRDLSIGDTDGMGDCHCTHHDDDGNA